MVVNKSLAPTDKLCNVFAAKQYNVEYLVHELDRGCVQCSNFTAYPSATTNDYLAAELRETLNLTAAVQPAAQLEAQLGRSYLEQALFPQGVTAICNFLAAHLPSSQVRGMLACKLLACQEHLGHESRDIKLSCGSL